MKYKSVIATRRGGPEVLQIIEPWPGNGKIESYGISALYMRDKKPFMEDLQLLFELLGEGKIKPMIMQKFPILEAAKANALLESGQVTGNIVLVAPELL